MEGVSWADLDADEQRAIAILGAGLSIELCEPLALLTLRRLGLVVGSHLTAAAHKLRRGVVLDELRRRDCSLKVSMRLGVRKMSGAIGLIVEGYVSLKDQKSLDELRIQRRKLIADLNACTGIDCTTTIQQIESSSRLGWRGWKAQRRDNRDPLLVFRLPPPIFFLRIHRS